MKIIFLSFAVLFPIGTQAAGFSLIEQSASGMGNAFAGGGAVAEDASTIYFNPAGMTFIKGTQIAGAIHLINPSMEFNGSISGTGKAGGNGGDAGDLALVPNIYYKMDLTDDLKFGLGINSPFGLKTEYDPTWMGRFQAINSDVKSININPALAYKVNDKLSVGAGVSAMWAQAKLTSAVNTAGDPTVNIKADDWGFGFNFGAIYQITDATRISAAYRSKVKQNFNGTSESTFTALNSIPSRTLNTNVIADITLPETVSFSAFSQLNEKFDLMGDITWTRWSQFKSLDIIRENGTTLSSTPENWSNVLRFSVGGNYHYSDDLKLRAGLAYDQEAVDSYRTARIPGNDRKWLSFGANWKFMPESSVDIGYAHLFISDATIDDNRIANLKGEGHLTGSYSGSVDILSAQITHNF